MATLPCMKVVTRRMKSSFSLSNFCSLRVKPCQLLRSLKVTMHMGGILRFHPLCLRQTAYRAHASYDLGTRSTNL